MIYFPEVYLLVNIYKKYKGIQLFKIQVSNLLHKIEM